jgi:hypothetical protein
MSSVLRKSTPVKWKVKSDPRIRSLRKEVSGFTSPNFCVEGLAGVASLPHTFRKWTAFKT